MINKICHVLPGLICFLVLAACHNGEINHKNNDTRLKSATTIIPNTQMSSSRTISENILADTSYGNLAEILKSTDLFELLSKPGPFTFFAPTNKAFKKLPDGTIESLINDRRNDLANILSHHVVAGLLQRGDLEPGQKLKTLAGEDLLITKRNDQLLVNGVRISVLKTRASNGMIYSIDDLLFPKSQNPGAY